MPALRPKKRPSNLLSNLQIYPPSADKECKFWFWNLFITKLPSSLKTTCLECNNLLLGHIQQ